MYSLAYFDKDGSGFLGSKNEPWLFDDYETKDEAKSDKEMLENQGYQSVTIINTPQDAIIE